MDKRVGHNTVKHLSCKLDHRVTPEDGTWTTRMKRFYRRPESGTDPDKQVEVLLLQPTFVVIRSTLGMSELLDTNRSSWFVFILNLRRNSICSLVC